MKNIFNFTDKTFDTLKWIAMVFLPAVAVAYLGMSDIWNLPYPSQIVGTISAIDTFIGVLLGIASQQYDNSKTFPLVTKNTSDPTLFFGIPLPTDGQVYDLLKWIAQIALPAFATFYFTLATVWNLGSPDKVVATIMTIDTFLGFLLDFSTTQFNRLAVAKLIENNKELSI